MGAKSEGEDAAMQPQEGGDDQHQPALQIAAANQAEPVEPVLVCRARAHVQAAANRRR